MFKNRLDNLPPEIIYIVFDYLSSHEILKAFSSLNSFFDEILSTYPCYRFDFKSISRSDFDLICNRIMPHQVISLTLSDMEDTPGQSELFFSRFQLTNFRQIQILKLINIEYASWENIYPYLNQIENYHRFSIESNNNDRVLDARVLFHANQIKIHTTNQLQTHSLPYLRSLTVSQSSIDQLESICSSADQLTSLKVNCLMFNIHDDLLLPAQQLIRIALYFNDIPVFMNHMERLLMNLPRLKYFEMSAKGSIDLTDGQVWERLTQQLITFHFNFWVQIDWTETMLDSFRTPYWIDEKNWFIAYTSGRLFSVPYFSQISANTSFQPPLYSTIPDKTIFYDRINHFVLNDSQRIPHGYFHHVKTLEIQSLRLLKDLSAFIDLNHVENFIVSSSINYSMISSLIKLMPVVRRFSINTQLTDFLQQTKNLCFGQIQTLEINEPSSNYSLYIIEQLVRLFPKVEILHVKSNLSKLGIAHLLERFENLSSVSFSRLHPPNEEIDTETSMTKFIVDKTERLKRDSFICRRRIYLTANQNHETFFDFWIKKQELGSLGNRHWLPKRGYNYYYLDNLIEHRIFSNIFLLTMYCSLSEFPILYAIYSSMGVWYSAFIQILLWLVLAMNLKYMKDPLISKLIVILTPSLYMISEYTINGHFHSFFWYNVYLFLCNPLQFTFGKDTGYLLIYFYLIFCRWICIIISVFRLNAFLSKCCDKLQMGIIYCMSAMMIFLIGKYIVLSIISFMSTFTLLTYLLIGVVVFLIIFLLKSRIR